MTGSPDVAPVAFGDLPGAVRALRERGLRLSTSRRLVLEALFAAEEPLSAERLAVGLALELTSVYRNLETLERHGLARHVHLGHGPGLYVLVGRGEREYLYCERCGAVSALSPRELDPIRDQVRARFGYEARFTHFPIVGTCAACSVSLPVRQDPPASEAAPGHGLHEHEHEHAHSHGDHVHSHVHRHEHADNGPRAHRH